MFSRISVASLLICASVSTGYAQRTQSTDSAIDHFIEHGAVADWQPYRLFSNCPQFESGQELGIDRLLAANLSPERERDLAVAWSIPLGKCRDPRLERWFFDHLEAAIRRGDNEGEMLVYWHALQYSDSPEIRQFLWNLMLDDSRPAWVRNTAGVTLLVRMEPAEKQREYLRAFETRRMPDEVAWGQTGVLLKQDADGLLREVGRRIRMDPSLTHQKAFIQIVESSGRFASASARRGLGEALEATLDRPGLTAPQRQQIQATADFLKRPVK